MAARDDATLLTARWVVGHDNGRHCLYENGEVVFQGDRIVYVGPRYPGPVARRHDYGRALIGPGFVDLDALSDLDTTILVSTTRRPGARAASGPTRTCSAARTRCIRRTSWRSRSATPSPS
ncbi:hypothetical protein [Achromobacter ruhlandii]|uniref:hypothetical protein n=1 Tax=Achromobacter ruhlandii TaxID=72557 RepID=UPI003B9E2CDD